MSNDRQTHVICYDISDDRTRARFARFLEKRAARVQFSIFEARLTRHEATELFAALQTRIGLADGLRMYCIPNAALEQVRVAGDGARPEDGDFWIL
jgi:CRISPR-associated protein Cas2